MPHPPLGILDITLVAGNDVNMDMEYTLPGRRPYIHADIVAVRAELLVQQLAFLGYQLRARMNLIRRKVKIAGNVATWDDHGMTRAHRVAVTGTVSKLILP